MGKIRIAFFLDVMQEDFDGVSITMHQVIKRIPTDRIDPFFVTPQPPKGEFPFSVRASKNFAFPKEGKEYRVALPKMDKGLKKALDRFCPDLVHFSSPTFLGRYAYKYAKTKQIPITAIYHTHFYGFMDYYFKKAPFLIRPAKGLIAKLYQLYKGCNCVFAPTPAMRDFLIGYGVGRENIKVWGRGVDTGRFNPGKKELGYWGKNPTGQKKVLFVSRLVKEKEPETLIRLYKLIDRREDLCMAVVGDGPTKKSLEANMPRAHFVGGLYGDDLAKAYASSDIFVFPSTTETFGNVVLEALASGLPVVAADAGGPRDIVKHQVTGEIVEPKNEKAFFDAIARLSDDRTYYDKCRKNAVEYARTQSWEVLCEGLFGTYFDLAGRSKNMSP